MDGHGKTCGFAARAVCGGVGEHFGQGLAAGAQGLHVGVGVVHGVDVSAVGAHLEAAVLARDGGAAGAVGACVHKRQDRGAEPLHAGHGGAGAGVVAQHVGARVGARRGVGDAAGLNGNGGVVGQVQGRDHRGVDGQTDLVVGLNHFACEGVGAVEGVFVEVVGRILEHARLDADGHWGGAVGQWRIDSGVDVLACRIEAHMGQGAQGAARDHDVT